MKSITVLLLCWSLTACANFPLFSDISWMKNPFADSSPDDTKQRGKQISAESSDPEHWYCYPNDTGLDWQCQNNPEKTDGSKPHPSPATPISALPTGGSEESIAANDQTSWETQPRDSLVMNDHAPLPADQLAASDYTPPPEPPVLNENTATDIEPTGTARGKTHGTSLVADTQELLQLPAGYFAVQLIALEDLAELQAYAHDKAIVDPLIVRIRTSNQKRFMVLLEGVYADKQRANEAAEAWILANPDSEKPWVRRLSTLQQAMREAAGNE